tara:strand:- start:1147 stop:1632 length:486 start_codon:yes stop_codon:yes gene_type:complete
MIVDLITECFYELLLMTKAKILRKKRLNFFRITQDYTFAYVKKATFDISNKIYHDSILSSLLHCEFFYGNLLAPPISDFNPDTAFGIGLKYIANFDSIGNYFDNLSDVWFTGVSRLWKKEVGTQIIQPFIQHKITRMREKCICTKILDLPDDITNLICEYL